jgi:hypothetical protein
LGLSKKEISGKGNWFPLEDEKFRASSIGEESKESPLLINPCIDNPEEHLQFHSTGLVDPLSQMGDASIIVYGLARDDLTTSRGEHARLVMMAVRCFKR